MRERASKAALRSWERPRWMKTEKERQLRLAGTVRKQSGEGEREGERGCKGGREGAQEGEKSWTCEIRAKMKEREEKQEGGSRE